MLNESLNGDALPLDLDPDAEEPGSGVRYHGETKTCCYEQCKNPAGPGRRGLCGGHYQNFQTYGHAGGNLIKTAEELLEATHTHGDRLSPQTLRRLGEAAVEYGAARDLWGTRLCQGRTVGRATMARARLNEVLFNWSNELHDLDAAALAYTDADAEAPLKHFLDLKEALERAAVAFYRATGSEPAALRLVHSAPAEETKALHVGPPMPTEIREAA